MPGAPTGLLGKLSAERPVLAVGVLVLSSVVLCILGVRESALAQTNDIVSHLAIAGLAVLCLPMTLAALAPERLAPRILFMAVTIIVGAGLMAIAFGAFDVAWVSISPLLSGSAFGLFLFSIALAPLTRNAIRLGVLGPLATLVGVVGAIGYFALQGVLGSPFSASIIAIALAGGVSVGAGIGADFAQYFAKGMDARSAASAAGHGGVAPSVFTIFAGTIFAGLVSFHANFGMADAQIIVSAFVAVLIATMTSLVGATAALAMIQPGEQTAVDENRRRQKFAEAWRPMRKLLPSTTALAASAIAGILLVIAAFEAGIDSALTLMVFLALILGASGLAFVSIRTSLLITALLFLSFVLTNYVYLIFDLSLPALPERFAALTLAALGFSQLTVSWRNAGDIWRNARDIAQNAMCDGLRRFLIALAAGATALIVSASAFSWEEGAATAGYYIIVASVGLVFAPVFMVALSARAQRY